MAKFLIVEARFYDHLNDMLVAGAKAALKAGLWPSRSVSARVPSTSNKRPSKAYMALPLLRFGDDCLKKRGPSRAS